MTRRRTFATSLAGVLLLLLLGYGAFVALAFRHEAARREAESLQRLSLDLASHIVEHWPQIADTDPAAAERAARQSVLGKLMAVNPGVQVYLLDADGRVADYLGEPDMVREPRVDLAPVRRFHPAGGRVLDVRGRMIRTVPTWRAGHSHGWSPARMECAIRHAPRCRSGCHA